MDLRDEILICISNISKVPKKELSMETEVYNSNIISSLGLLDIIAYIERQYKIVVKPEELIHDNFKNIQAIVDFIQSKLG